MLELRGKQRALEAFEASSKMKIEDGRIDLDQARHRADHAKDELEELIAMYEAEEFAEITKELIIKRGRRNLEVAERRMALAERRHQHLLEVEIPMEREKHEQAIVAAQNGVRSAELAMNLSDLESRLRLMEAKGALDAHAEAAAEESR